MSFNVPPIDYNYYIKSITDFDNKAMEFTKVTGLTTLASSIYIISQGIIPFFTDTINPSK